MKENKKSGWKLPALAVMFAILLILPLFIKNTYILKVINNVFIYSIIALSVNLLLGFTGLLDFGRSAFVGIGTYSFAILMWKVSGVPWIIGFLFAVVFTTLIGYVVGMFLERTSFDYLTLITIGIVEIVRLFLNNCIPLTNGGIGITGVPAPSIFGLRLKGHKNFYYFCLIMLVICYILIRRLTQSYKGRALMAIRDDEIAATYSAINLPRYKAFIFGVASMFTAIGGVIMVSYTGYASPLNFTIDEGLLLCQMAILGGLGSLPGSVLGAAILVIVPELSRTAYEYRLLIMGIMMVVLMLFCPNGILGRNGIKDRIIAQIRKRSGKEA